MRFKSKSTDGFQVFAVSGVNTISFAVRATDAARRGLLGFAVERHDLAAGERYFMPSYKVFESRIPNPSPLLSASTWDHPVQSFAWDDFTAKDDQEYDYYFYPLRGTPKNLDRSASPVSIRVRAEPLYTTGTHDVFFNRGIASSQAYRRRFGNRAPDEQETPEKQAEALKWLTRNLEEAILRFIEQAHAGDTLLGCFYEFRYAPVANALKAAVDRGVDVKLILDAKVNERTDSKTGKIHKSFPREDNLQMLRTAKIPRRNVILREARASSIAHNKFMVLLKGASQKPTEVWTGSTNLSQGGFSGQTNVGHWVRDGKVALQFRAYWDLLSKDPGGTADDEPAEVRRKNAELRRSVAQLRDVNTDIAAIPVGTDAIFSPRSDDGVLAHYVDMVDSADSCSCITLAFGVGKAFKDRLIDNTPDSPLVFMLLEKEDKPDDRNPGAYVAINAKQNVYKAWGSYIKDPVYQWARETNAKLLALNTHVAYVHSKFLLRDPLGDDPIVVTGSANFSTASTKENDENMLVIRGDRRVADIYFTEFNRLFNHYYFRAVRESALRRDEGDTNAGASLFLSETSEEWLAKYKPDSLKAKRLAMFTGMKGAVDG